MKPAAIVAFLLGLGFLPAFSHAAERCELEYRFTARWDVQPRRFDVDVIFDGGKRTTTELHVAENWGPVKDYGRAIQGVHLIAPSGAVWQPDANRAWSWTARHEPGARVHVRYEILNDVPNVDAATPLSHVDFYRTMLGATWFQFYGHGALLVPGSIDADKPLTACISFSGLPREWAFASSQGGDRRGRMRTRTSLNELDASIFLGGDFRTYRRPMHGGQLVVAMRGRWSFDDAKFVDATARVMRVHREFWDDRIPLYLVSFIPNRKARGESGGTGLYRSFAMHASDDLTVPGPDFDHLIGHEDMHTWVPHRLGTVGSHDSIQYWFSEGLTDYLAHRLLVTARVWTLDDYANYMNHRIRTYEHWPLRNATNAALARDFWKDPYAERMPYQRGELLIARWSDALEARGVSLRKTLRSLLLPGEATEDEGLDRPDRMAALRFTAAVRAVAGASIDGDVAQYVEEGQTIPLSPGLLGPCFTGKPVAEPAFELGFDPSTLRSHIATGIVPGSAAERAGLREGMRLSFFKVDFGSVDREIELTTVEGETTHDLKYRPQGSGQEEIYQYQPISAASSDAACRRWIEAR